MARREPKKPARIQAVLGRRIRSLRERKDWSQERLAEEADLHRTYVGGIERGERNVSVANVERIATSLGVAVRDLFTEE